MAGEMVCGEGEGEGEGKDEDERALRVVRCGGGVRRRDGDEKQREARACTRLEIQRGHNGRHERDDASICLGNSHQDAAGVVGAHMRT